MLEVRDLHVRFHNRDRDAVGGISFTIADGEILGLVGESGSGKTVTAMSIAGLLPRKQCTYSGDILLNGQDLLHADRSLLRKLHGREIGVVFQEPMSSMDPLMRIGEQVGEVLRIHTTLSAKERKEKALQAMDAVELNDVEKVYRSYPHELSGGMLQRAMIAAAIVIEPSLLLLDEPTTALDVTIQAQILELLKRLNRELGISMLFISHNLNVVYYLCDRIAVMYRGSIVEQGDSESLYNSPMHPYTRTLLSAIPEIEEGDELSRYGYQETRREPAPDGCAFYHRCPFATEQCRQRPELRDVLSETQRTEKNSEHFVRCWNPVRSGD